MTLSERIAAAPVASIAATLRTLSDDPAMVERATNAVEQATLELQGKGAWIATSYNDSKAVAQAVLRAIGGGE